MHPLLYLTWHSFKNRLRVRVQRLREPRYLLGFVVGLAYFYFIFFRSTARGGRPPLSSIPGFDGILGFVEMIGALALFLFVASAWLPQGSGSPALPFTRADVQFLFPAPFTRRQLIRYRILRSQLSSLVGSAFFTVILKPGSAARGWTFLIGFAIVMSTIRLHMMGITLNRSSMREHGWLGLKRQWLVPAFFAGATIVLGITVYGDWVKLSSLEGLRSVLTELQDLFSTGAAAAVLWPFRAVARLPLSSSTAAFFRALPWTLGILALNYVWVVRSDTAFEEASAEFAEKWAARRKKGIQPSVRPKNASATPFTLAAEGRPEMAILWKNMIMVGRYLSLKTLFILVPFLVFFGIPIARNGSAGFSRAIGGASFFLSIMVLIVGPLMARNDLRQDLGNLAMLKAWPIRGAALVRGEVLAPAVILTATEWLLAILLLIFSPAGASRSYPFIVAGILLAPGIILAQLLVQNALAVMFPSWVRIGQNQPRGIDVMGQRMFMVFGMMIVLVVALLPAALLAGVAGFIGYSMTKTIPIIVPAAIAAAALLVECHFASEAIGRLLDRTDVSAIDAAEQ